MSGAIWGEERKSILKIMYISPKLQITCNFCHIKSRLFNKDLLLNPLFLSKWIKIEHEYLFLLKEQKTFLTRRRRQIATNLDGGKIFYSCFKSNIIKKDLMNFQPKMRV